MKAKSCLFWFTILAITSIQMVYPQSIWFESPTEGQTITNTSSSSETNITVNLVIKAKGSAPLSNPNYAYIRVYDQNMNLLYGPKDTSYDNNNYELSHSFLGCYPNPFNPTTIIVINFRKSV